MYSGFFLMPKLRKDLKYRKPRKKAAFYNYCFEPSASAEDLKHLVCNQMQNTLV